MKTKEALILARLEAEMERKFARASELSELYKDSKKDAARYYSAHKALLAELLGLLDSMKEQIK